MNIVREFNFKKLLDEPSLKKKVREKKREKKNNFKWKRISEADEEADEEVETRNSNSDYEEDVEGKKIEINESRDESEDEEDPGSEGLGSALIIGKSNTGKSTLVRRLVEKYNLPLDAHRPIFLLNDQTGKKAPRGVQKISWNQILDISKCCLIVEDLVKCNKRQVDALSNLINVQNHHAQVRPIFFITHTLRGNGFYGLLKCYNAICLATETSHRDELKEIVTRFHFSDELSARCIELFQLGCAQGKFTFLWIDLDSKNAILIKAEKFKVNGGGVGFDSSAENNKDNKISKLKEKAKLYFSLMPDANQGACIVLFDMICSKLFNNIDEHDLCLKGKNNKGESFRASIVDYINILLSPRPSDATSENAEKAPPYDDNIFSLHSYIKAKNVLLPKCYIKNKNMII